MLIKFDNVKFPSPRNIDHAVDLDNYEAESHTKLTQGLQCLDSN